MALERFHYTTTTGIEVVLPKFGAMPAGVVRRNRHLEGEAQMWAMLEMWLGADSPELAALDAVPAGELVAFMEAWQKDSSVGLGESTPS